MSKKSERLLEILSEIDDRKIDRAAPTEKRIFHWKRWSALAALLVLAVGAGSYLLPRLLWMEAPGSSAGGNGHEDGSTLFMSYAGPVFPLTLKEAEQGLTARRQITLDFAPWAEAEGVSADIEVTDAYTLTNVSEKEMTVSVLYPFASSLRDLYRNIPVLTVEGQAQKGVLHAGGCADGFQNADGSQEEIQQDSFWLNSWEQYQALLSDGGYQAAALKERPDLSDVPVTVYRFTDPWGPEPEEEAGIPNPSIQAGFDLDYSKTTVLTYGFHGASFDQEAGTMIQEFSIPKPDNSRYGNPYYLFVVGEDIRNLTTGGYVTGGMDADTETLEEWGVNVERYETDLESALRGAAELMYEEGNWEDIAGKDSRPVFELYFSLMKEYLVFYGPLSENGPERYGPGWLEEMYFEVVDRVFYLETEVTIPAGESLLLSARMTREASFDYYCADTENRGVYGYDLVTKLGSSLDITDQTAVLADRKQIEIVRQNFGFDLEKGVNEVTMDPKEEHYYLEIRKR